MLTNRRLAVLSTSAFLLLVSLVVSGWARCALGNSAEQTKPRSDRPVKVLFIGNSYTYFNNLSALLEDL